MCTQVQVPSEALIPWSWSYRQCAVPNKGTRNQIQGLCKKIMCF